MGAGSRPASVNEPARQSTRNRVVVSSNPTTPNSCVSSPGRRGRRQVWGVARSATVRVEPPVAVDVDGDHLEAGVRRPAQPQKVGGDDLHLGRDGQRLGEDDPVDAARSVVVDPLHGRLVDPGHPAHLGREGKVAPVGQLGHGRGQALDGGGAGIGHRSPPEAEKSWSSRSGRGPPATSRRRKEPVPARPVPKPALTVAPESSAKTVPVLSKAAPAAVVRGTPPVPRDAGVRRWSSRASAAARAAWRTGSPAAVSAGPGGRPGRGAVRRRRPGRGTARPC